MQDYLPFGGALHLLLPFPPQVGAISRTWDSLRGIVRGQSSAVRSEHVAVCSALDAERAFDVFMHWHQNGSGSRPGLLFAPFGPKPHTLAMVLFCLRNPECGVMYTQPRVYDPAYSAGYAVPTGYVVKWDSVSCFARTQSAGI